MPVKAISGDVKINNDKPWRIIRLPRVIPHSHAFKCLEVSSPQPHYPLKIQTRSIKQRTMWKITFHGEKKDISISFAKYTNIGSPLLDRACKGEALT